MPEAHGPASRDVAATPEGPASPHREAGAGRDVGALSDAGLISAITFDDVDAFAEAYDRHGDAVYGVARRLYEQHQAEEMTRQVFLALWHSAEHFSEPDRPLRAALLAEAHRRGVAFLRTEAAVHTGETNPPDAAARAPLPAGTTVGRLLSGASRDRVPSHHLGLLRAGTRTRTSPPLVERPKEAVLADIRAGLRRFSDREPDHGSGQ